MTEIILRDGRIRRIFRLVVRTMNPAPDALSAARSRWNQVILPEPDPGFHRLDSFTRYYLHDPENWHVFTVEWCDEEYDIGSCIEATENTVRAQQMIALRWDFAPLHHDGTVFPHMPQYDRFYNRSF